MKGIFTAGSQLLDFYFSHEYASKLWGSISLDTMEGTYWSRQ